MFCFSFHLAIKDLFKLGKAKVVVTLAGLTSGEKYLVLSLLQVLQLDVVKATFILKDNKRIYLAPISVNVGDSCYKLPAAILYLIYSLLLLLITFRKDSFRP